MGLWTLAVVDLGISSDEFWRLTPREFFALINRKEQRDRLENYRAGLGAAAVFNVNRSKRTSKVWSPFDFFGESQRDGAQDPQEVYDQLQRVVQAMGSRAHPIYKAK